MGFSFPLLKCTLCFKEFDNVLLNYCDMFCPFEFTYLSAEPKLSVVFRYLYTIRITVTCIGRNIIILKSIRKRPVIVSISGFCKKAKTIICFCSF